MSDHPDWADAWVGTECAGCREEYEWKDGKVMCDCSVIRLGVLE